MSGPYSVRRRGAFLHLELDTPGSPVNILTPEATVQLEELLPAIDPRQTRAVVFGTKKRHSFINGARLLYAAAVRTPEQAKSVALEVRRAFTAVARCPVPTIAAIRGSCYGCGLEFALWCDHRVASDAWDTELYLTEIIDYLLTPVFGSTQRLPPLVGFEAAIELILWGRRVRAKEGKEMGLIDRVISRDRWEDELDEVLADLAHRAEPPAPRAPPSAETREHILEAIEALPPELRAIHRSAYELCLLPFDKSISPAWALDAELESFARSVTTRESERAVSFFFVRQTAATIGTGVAAADLPPRFVVEIEDDPHLAEWERILRERPLAGVIIGGRKPSLSFRAAPRRGGLRDVGVIFGSGSTPAAPQFDATVYFPRDPEKHAICEVALGPDVAAPPPKLVDLLRLLGFAPVVTHPPAKLVSDRLIEAWRPNRDLAAVIAEGLRCLDDGAVEHRAQIELLAHLLFDLPIHLGSVFRRLADPELAAAVDRALGRDEVGPRKLLASGGFVNRR